MPPLSGVHLGYYLGGETWPYRLDPRAKLLGLFFYTLAAFLSNRPGTLLAVVAAGGGIWLVARLPGRPLLVGLRPLLLLAVMIFFFHLLFTPGPPLARIGPLAFSGAGAWLGLMVAARLLAVGGAAAFLLATTRPLELMEAGASLLQPLKRLRLPVGDISLLLGLSLRFIPMLAEEAEKISRAQKARGLDWEKGPPWQRLANRSALFFPLLVGLFRRAEEVATAMEVRGYRRGVARTSLYTWRWSWADSLLLALMVALLVFSLLGRWWPGLALL